MSGQNKHSNEYRMFENKSITKKPSNTEEMNRVQNIWIKLWKYKVVECLEI